MLANVAQGSNFPIGSVPPRYAWYPQNEVLRTVRVRVNDRYADDPIESAASHPLNNKFLEKGLRGLIGRKGG